jgi:ATP-dependent DNA ligase
VSARLYPAIRETLGSSRFKEALASLPVQNAIIDGEIVCLDAHGVSQFNQLLGRKGEPVLYALKKRLAALIQSSACERILYAQHIRGTRQAIL